MPRPDMPTMDLTHGMTFASRIRGQHVNAQARSVLARYRAELRRAERFIIDDESVRFVCRLSHEYKRLPSFAFLARLPFDVCWFELNLRVKVAEFNTMNRVPLPDWSEVPERVGLLLYKDDPGSASPRWVATQILQHNGETTPAPISFVFDPEGDDYAPVRGSLRWRAPTLSLLPNFPRINVPYHPHDIDADAECLLTGDLRFDHDEDRYVADEWTQNRAAAIVDPYWQAQLANRRKTLYEVLKVEVREEMGHMRWLMTMLAAINHLPREIKPVQTLIGKRTVGANILPYFQHRTISIKLPRDERIVWAQKHMQTALRNAPRAWHRVSGHWRIIERGKTPKYICRHMPTMVEAGLGMCERCQLLIRWIPDHHRGDPNVGVVEHTYRVTAK